MLTPSVKFFFCFFTQLILMAGVSSIPLTFLDHNTSSELSNIFYEFRNNPRPKKNQNSFRPVRCMLCHAEDTGFYLDSSVCVFCVNKIEISKAVDLYLGFAPAQLCNRTEECIRDRNRVVHQKYGCLKCTLNISRNKLMYK